MRMVPSPGQPDWRRGSAPREAEAMMLISPDDIWQTIGAGTLIWVMAARARPCLPMPAGTGVSSLRHLVDMGQCCGGVVRLLLRFPLLNVRYLPTLPPCRLRSCWRIRWQWGGACLLHPRPELALMRLASAL